MLKAVVPHVKRIGVLYNPIETGALVGPAAKEVAALGLELMAIPVTSPDRLQDGLRRLERHIDALWSVADSTVFASDRAIELLLRQTLHSKIPCMGLSPAFVKAGALLALAVDYQDVGGQCGEQAAHLLRSTLRTHQWDNPATQAYTVVWRREQIYEIVQPVTTHVRREREEIGLSVGGASFWPTF
jgi:ABC-type uncharacterized transport system substrate-binding protein